MSKHEVVIANGKEFRFKKVSNRLTKVESKRNGDWEHVSLLGGMSKPATVARYIARKSNELVD